MLTDTHRTENEGLSWLITCFKNTLNHSDNTLPFHILVFCLFVCLFFLFFPSNHSLVQTHTHKTKKVSLQ